MFAFEIQISLGLVSQGPAEVVMIGVGWLPANTKPLADARYIAVWNTPRLSDKAYC